MIIQVTIVYIMLFALLVMLFFALRALWRTRTVRCKPSKDKLGAIKLS